MSQYRITATITSQTQATDSGAWQMGITWRKSLTLDPAETQEAADLRNQAWEQAANGIDDETTRRIWQQVDTVTAREAERLRAQVRKLIVLLNAGRPALDENGYPMWDHLIACLLYTSHPFAGARLPILATHVPHGRFMGNPRTANPPIRLRLQPRPPDGKRSMGQGLDSKLYNRTMEVKYPLS